MIENLPYLPPELVNKIICYNLEPTQTSLIIKKYYNISFMLYNELLEMFNEILKEIDKYGLYSIDTERYFKEHKKYLWIAVRNIIKASENEEYKIINNKYDYNFRNLLCKFLSDAIDFTNYLTINQL